LENFDFGPLDLFRVSDFGFLEGDQVAEDLNRPGSAWSREAAPGNRRRGGCFGIDPPSACLAYSAVDPHGGQLDDRHAGWLDSGRAATLNIADVMELHELVIEMKLLERRLTLYEEKYGILSEDFYAALSSGELEAYDEFDETRVDFSRWKGIHETWMRRKEQYREKVSHGNVSEKLRVQPIV
jgi:hypothetical protein